MNHQKPILSPYDSVMAYYLVVGAAGLFFSAVLILSEYDWADPALNAAFGEHGLEGLAILGTIAAIFLILGGWIPAIWIVYRFRNTWQVWAPSALFLVAEATLVTVFVTVDETGPILDWTLNILFGLYFLAALMAGVRMLLVRGQSGRSNGQIGNQRV